MPVGPPVRFEAVVVASLVLVATVGIVAIGASTGGVGAIGFDQRTGEWADRSPRPDAVACPASASATAEERVSDADDPRIVELYPNPVARGNVGEYFVVELPDGAAGENLTVTDGHANATVPLSALPDQRLDRNRVAASVDPDETRDLTDDPVLELDGHLRLAADGDELELANDSGTLDAVAYDRAPEGSVWYRTEDDADSNAPAAPTIARGEWWPRGATCLPTSTARVDEVTAFVLPDSPTVPLDFVESADDRIRLAGYTFTDEDVTSALVDALDRGVRVDVLLEAGPVGGTPEETKPLLDELEAAGASVRVLGGDGARYAFHHPKYAVADDRALVTTENWKPSGVGGASSRGWGAVVEDAALAADLTRVFEADHAGYDTIPWRDHRERAAFVDDDSATGEYPETVPADSIDAERVELLLAPDNAEDRLIELLRSAEESIRINQVRIESPDFVLLEETLDAAREGVDVEILLDDSWYVVDENRELARRLEETAAAENLPLEVRLAGRTDRFEKVHAKGIVVDGETAIVGSINWNDNSLRENREVALVLEGEEIAGFYASVFEADWDGDGGWRLPIELAVLVVAGLLLAGLAGRRYVRFESAGTESPGLGESPRPVTIDPDRPDSRRSTRSDNHESVRGAVPPSDRSDRRESALDSDRTE